MHIVVEHRIIDLDKFYLNGRTSDVAEGEALVSSCGSFRPGTAPSQPACGGGLDGLAS